MGPEESVKLAFAAKRHYIDGRSRVEIAAEMGVSRFRVARMLDDAREAGMVNITVRAPGPVDADLSKRLQDAFGLRRALAVATPVESPELVQQYLGRVAALLLSEIAVDGDVIGLTAGRTMSVMARSLTNISHCDVVQLAGVAGPIQSTAVDVIRRVSRAAEGNAFTLYAPLVASDKASARAIRRQIDVQNSLEQINRVTLAMVAIGSWAPPDSEMYHNAAIGGGRRQQLLDRGVQAEIGATLIDTRGRVVDDIAELCIAASTEQLRAIGEVIGVAGGENKTEAVRVAIASGVIDSLVTDCELARRLLSA